LDLSGPSMPAGIRLRESPTLASTGQTTIRSNATGGFYVSSFFDVFTEISLDGGSTWHPASGGSQLVLNAEPIISPELVFASNNLPPHGHIVSPRDVATDYTNGRSIRNLDLSAFMPQASPPALGATRVDHLTLYASLEVSGGGGGSFSPIS
jgi:hypothetical protein